MVITVEVEVAAEVFRHMNQYSSKNSGKASLVHMKYLESLMNMNSRSTCPRCEGNLVLLIIRKRIYS